MAFTKEQQRVIDLREKNILVSAAAGSGKTRVLVERIVKKVREGVSIDRMLVVTFTKAAAGEMRDRIGKALQDALEQNPDDEHLQRQTTLIYNAQITTIDSFCLFLLRNHFQEIGLDPAFRVADEGEVRLLKEDLLDTFIEECFAVENPDVILLEELYGGGPGKKGLRKLLTDVTDFALSHPWPSLWLTNIVKTYEIGNQGPDILPELIYMGRERLQEACEYLQEALNIAHQSAGPWMYGEMLEQECESVKQVAALTEGDYEGFRLELQKITFGKLSGKKDETVDSVLRDRAKTLRDMAKKICGDLQDGFFACSVEELSEQDRALYPVVCAISRLGRAYLERLDAQKRSQGIIDFSDMEHLALQILVSEVDRQGKPVRISRSAEELRSYYEEIMIDEYQDSNLVQETILSVIARENNRFLVGDVKQSIYRFRMARPELFMEKMDSFGEDGVNIRIDLDRNFRSREEVLEGTNLLFSRIMRREIGGVEYEKKVSLKPGKVYPENQGDNSMELLLLQKNPESKESGMEQEAHLIARKIREMVGKYPIMDPDTEALRPARYRDMVILLRSISDKGEQLRKILEEEGIPAFLTSQSGYFQVTEVSTLLHFLRILSNPLQDLSLFCVMKSSLGAFGDEELAMIRVTGKEERCLYHSVEQTAKTDSLLAKKCRDFLQMIDRYRKQSAYLSVRELLRNLLEETGYLYTVSAMPAGEKRRANVEMLLAKAAGFEQTSFYGVHHFIRYIEQLEKYEVDYGEANILDENADVVRIMSIHKSKGLEFPICFVGNLSGKFNVKDTTGEYLIDMDRGLGLQRINPTARTKSPTVRRQLMSRQMRRDSLGEELRVLYVAMTRARDKLFMTAIVGEEEKLFGDMRIWKNASDRQLPTGMIATGSSYLDWILPAIAPHRELDERRLAYGNHIPVLPELHDHAANIKLQWVLPEDTKIERVEQEVNRNLDRDYLLTLTEGKREQLDEGMEEKFSLLWERLHYRYPHENLAGLFTKTTVSELKLSAMEQIAKERGEAQAYREFEKKPLLVGEEETYIPAFARESREATGAARGTAFHRVLELLPFDKIADRQGLEEELNRLMEQGRIDSSIREQVSEWGIWQFLQSPVAQRMKAAILQKKLFREQPFVLGIPAKRLKPEAPEGEILLVQGIIDVYFEEEGQIVVLDYKTDRVASGQELVDRYQTQLDYYSEALEQLTGKKVREKILYSFCLQQEVVVR